MINSVTFHQREMILGGTVSLLVQRVGCHLTTPGSCVHSGAWCPAPEWHLICLLVSVNRTDSRSTATLTRIKQLLKMWNETFRTFLFGRMKIDLMYMYNMFLFNKLWHYLQNWALLTYTLTHSLPNTCAQQYIQHIKQTDEDFYAQQAGTGFSKPDCIE